MPLYLCRYIPTRPAQQFTRRLIHQRSLPASPRGCGEDMYAVEKMAPSLDSSPRHEIFHFLFSEKNRFFYFLLTRLLEWQYSDPSTPNKTKSSCRACFRISFIINSSLIFSSRFRIKKCAITAKRGRLVSNNEGFELKFCGRRLPPWSPSSPQFAKDPILSPGIGLYSPCRSYARFLPWLCHGFWHWSTSLEVPCLSFRELEMVCYMHCRIASYAVARWRSYIWSRVSWIWLVVCGWVRWQVSFLKIYCWVMCGTFDELFSCS